MPKMLLYILLIGLVALLIPPALIASTRSTVKKKPRVHFVQDMDNQHRYKAQQINEFFKDDRAMRQPVEGTIARGALNEDEHFFKGLAGDDWATTFPSQIDMSVNLIERGRDRFNIYCRPCHGAAGFGDGIVHQRAFKLVTAGVNGTTWVQPKSVHEAAIREQPIGQTFNTITNGVRTMPGYADQIPVADRWAIVAYVKALQRSQSALDSDLPPGTSRSDLLFEALPKDETAEADAPQDQQDNTTAQDDEAEQP